MDAAQGGSLARSANAADGGGQPRPTRRTRVTALPRNGARNVFPARKAARPYPLAALRFE